MAVLLNIVAAVLNITRGMTIISHGHFDVSDNGDCLTLDKYQMKRTGHTDNYETFIGLFLVHLCKNLFIRSINVMM